MPEVRHGSGQEEGVTGRLTRPAGRAAVELVAAAVAVTGAWQIRRPAPTAAMRGARLAAAQGCFACHGPGGTGGVPNPRSEEGEVPAWSGGTLMMYVTAPEEVREWIQDGVSRRRASQSGGYHPPGL